MRGSPPARLVLLELTWLALTLALGGSACSGKGSSSGLDAGGANDGAGGNTGTAGGGAGMNGGAAGAGGGANANAGASGAAGPTGGAGGTPVGAGGALETGGAAGPPDAGADAAAPDLTNCPIRNCVERFLALQARCAAFGVACVREVHGSQTNYCLANGVRTYVDSDGVTALATMIRADGHTCYTVYITYSSGGPTTGAITDPDGNVIMLETDSSDDKTVTFSCNGMQWEDDRVSCGAGGISSFPFNTVDCPKTSSQMCLRP